MELLQDHLLEVALLATTAAFPSSTFKEEAVDISAALSKCGQISNVLRVQNICLQLHLIKRKTAGTGSHLLDGSQVGHWVEQTSEPHNNRRGKLLGPSLKLLDTEEKVREPVNESLIGEVRDWHPRVRNLVEVERRRSCLHSVGDVELTLKASVQLQQACLNFLGKHVHALALLEAHNDVRGAFLGLAHDIEHVEVCRKLLKETSDE